MNGYNQNLPNMGYAQQIPGNTAGFGGYNSGTTGYTNNNNTSKYHIYL